MSRQMIVAGIALGIAAAPCVADGPTQFRKRHQLFLEARAGHAMELTFTAISASLGYPDALAYRIYGPSGTSAAQGRLEPGESRTFTLVPEADGLYAIDANPGMNAFSVEVGGATWGVNLAHTRQLNLIDNARPLYFHVPPDLEELTLTFSGEPGRVELFAPDGSSVTARDLPQYETVTLTAPVAPGQSGWWRMELELAEDQGITIPPEIPPYVTEQPLEPSLLAALGEGMALVDFDMRPTPVGQLLRADRPAIDATLRTADGFTLRFDSAGRLAAVAIDGRELAGGAGAPLLGFFARDAVLDSDLVAFEGDSRRTADGLRVSSRAPGLDLELDAEYRAAEDHIAVDISLRDGSGEDRAVTLYFALPFPPGEVTWWDDILTSRPATGNVTLGAFDRMSAGANGHHSIYPLGCVAGEEGLALGVPMDRPIYHRIAASPASRQLFLAVDLALTEATAKFPGRADLSFVLCRCDPRWGLRSALERYYRIFPHLFERRMPQYGGWVCWGNCAELPNLEQLGFKYHWGPSGPEAVAFDDAHDLYSFLYSDSARYFADLGQFDERPSPEEARAAMRRLLDSEDPRAHILSVRESATGRNRYEGREETLGREAAEQWLRDSVAAVKRSAALDANGRIQVGYLTNRADWGGTDWWTGRVFCNIDPDIPGGYGQFLFDRILRPTVERYRQEAGELDGFGLDNYFTNAHSLDFSREHLAACDFPPTFAAGDFRPVVAGAVAVCEWAAELKRGLEAEGKWLIANTGRQPFCFSQHLLDINGLEWGLAHSAPAARALAYHKPVVTLPVQAEHYEEPFIRSHLPFAIIPGGYARGDRFGPETQVAALYDKYVPILTRMAAAGWEPVPWAVADSPAVTVERFGGDLPLMLSICNREEERASATITVDLRSVGITGAQSVMDLVDDRRVPAEVADGELTFEVALGASDATAVEIR
ncbi:MAG: hypothetical protein U9R79_17650 [Armatimonadota bacterium]|nr:hypothetical protein [Armatimonadota bacterium]